MITKGLFRLAILPGTLAGFYCNETTNGQYFSECAMAVKDSPLEPSKPVVQFVHSFPLYEHLHARYTTSWHEQGSIESDYNLKIEIDDGLDPNPNRFNLEWSKGTVVFKGIAQRHGDWLYGNYWEVDKEKK